MILKILDAVGGVIWNETREAVNAAKHLWDETPRTVESETDRKGRMILAAGDKFRYIIDNDLCGCPNCKEKRDASLPDKVY